MRRALFVGTSVLALSTACTAGSGRGGTWGVATDETTGDASTGTPAEGTGTQEETGGVDGSDAPATSDGDDGLKLDVGATPDIPLAQDGCNQVDILFVIDSSASMNDEQLALGEAFPQFTATMVETLPPGTSLHVGVTTTEMGEGGLNSVQYPCDSPSEDYYVTPDVDPSAVNGAQGRLFEVPGSPRWFEVATDASAAELAELDAWFVQAAAVGIEGSSEEMPLGAAGWAFDPVNAPTNEGFVRDEGAALVLFFVTDESDQTPIDGVAQGLIDRIAEAKSGCGGLSCVAAGGTARSSCFPEDALGMFFAALDPTHVHVEPLEYNTQTEPDLFVNALKDNLSQIIVDVCETIPPAG